MFDRGKRKKKKSQKQRRDKGEHRHTYKKKVKNYEGKHTGEAGAGGGESIHLIQKHFMYYIFISILFRQIRDAVGTKGKLNAKFLPDHI